MGRPPCEICHVQPPADTRTRINYDVEGKPCTVAYDICASCVGDIGAVVTLLTERTGGELGFHPGIASALERAHERHDTNPVSSVASEYAGWVAEFNREN